MGHDWRVTLYMMKLQLESEAGLSSLGASVMCTCQCPGVVESS